MPTYSPTDFEGSPFDYGERIQLHLYAPSGVLMQTVTGRLQAREEGVDVGGGRSKTLVWVKEIEGYGVPHEDLPETTTEKTEGWFPEHDIEKIEKGPLAAFSRN